MIVETVTFKVRPDMSYEDLMQSCRDTLDRWRGYPGLERKIYAMADAETAVGIYLWESREHAEKGHDDAWLDEAERLWGNRPQIAYLDAMMILDNRLDEVCEFPETS